MIPGMTTVAARIADIIGSQHVLTDTAALAACEVDGLRPSVVTQPGSAADVAEIVKLCAAERLALIPMGGRSKLGIGMPPSKYDLALDLSRMNRVLAYDPGDLTLGVEPGVRFADLERELAAKGQCLPLAPAFAARATLGGIVASAADSPLRHSYGSARDQLLGMEFVTGAGVMAKSGGKVVKNVSGYDIHQLLIGSLGTLAIITRLNFRTFPMPANERVFVAAFANGAAALEYCRAVGKSQLQPRFVEACSPAAARVMGDRRIPQDGWSVLIGAAGNAAVVERQERDLLRMARELRANDFAGGDGPDYDALFSALREFQRLVREANRNAVLFRIAILPTAMPEMVRRLEVDASSHGVTVAVLVRAAGVIYAAILPDGDDAPRLAAAARDLMQASLACGGRPMIESCPASLKRDVNVWPPAGSDQPLAERLKRLFDPQGSLAPGRFLGGL
jgi:glycolate oxidase FAD binding subunit